jgi:hypothetical protein
MPDDAAMLQLPMQTPRKKPATMPDVPPPPLLRSR